MKDYQQAFIEFALASGVLCFGEFTLKSGRVSPYFFNSGLFNTGDRLARLGRYYADALADSGIAFDGLFGPAYKGIPLVSTLAVALADHHGRDVPYSFDRKEAKDHGEGGSVVGSPLAGRIVIVDDVISSGMSIDGSVDMIRAAGAEPAGAIIALDRQERGLDDRRSAVQSVSERHGMRVASIVSLADLIDFLAGRHADPAALERIRAYRDRYGAAG